MKCFDMREYSFLSITMIYLNFEYKLYLLFILVLFRDLSDQQVRRAGKEKRDPR